MSQPLRIGVMGCANIAKNLVIPAMLQVDNLELVAIASRTMEKAKSFTDEFGGEPIGSYQELVDRPDVDIIYMPLPTGLHEEWVNKCLDAGKHLLVEKSLALDLPSAQRMVAKAREKGLIMMENFMFRYHSQHQFVFKLLKDGELGDIRCIRASFGFPPLGSDNFRYDPEMGGGALLDAGAYMAKLSHWFLGDSTKVKAANLHLDEDGKGDIHGTAYLSNDQGLTAEVAWGFDNFYQCNYEIWGSKGKVTLTRALTPRPDFNPIAIVEKQGETKEHSLKTDDHFKNIITECCRAIRENDGDQHLNEVLIQAELLSQIKKLGI